MEEFDKAKTSTGSICMVEEDERFVDRPELPKSSLQFAVSARRRETFNEKFPFLNVFILLIDLRSFLKRLDVDLV